jgi:hypothetical protein
MGGCYADRTHAFGLFKRFNIPKASHGTRCTGKAAAHVTGQPASVAGCVEEWVCHELIGSGALLWALLAAPAAHSERLPAHSF